MTDKTPAQLLSHKTIMRTVAANEAPIPGTPATFDAWCHRCRARTPHRTVRYGRFVTWLCNMCGDDHEQKAA